MLPVFSAGFDSGAGFIKALSNFLKGREFQGLGITPPVEPLLETINKLPVSLNEKLFITATGAEGIPAANMNKVDASEFMKAVVNTYPDAKYPAVMLGAVSGAMVHLAAALKIPLLPQTFLIPVSHPAHLPVDEPKRTLEWGLKPGENFLKNNPYFKLHHMFDPVQDRQTLEKITYFRVKMQRMVLEYERFLINNLQKGGTIIISDCTQKWPVTTISNRFVFQFGGVGATTPEEYHEGSKRVSNFLEKYDSHVRRWEAPKTDSSQPEAEWGFDDLIMNDITAIAQRHGFRIKRLTYQEPDHPSPAIAEMYRWWYRQKDVITNRLVAESFFMHEPYWILKTASVPFWMKFNTEHSADWLEQYLTTAESYDEVYLMLFSHGVESIGLAKPQRWKHIMRNAAVNWGFIGNDPDKFPSDPVSMVKYNSEFKRRMKSRYDFQLPLTLRQMNRFFDYYNQSGFSSLIKIEDIPSDETGKTNNRPILV